MSTQDEPDGPDDTASTASSGEEEAREGTGADEGTSPRDRLRGWFTGRLPAGWFAAAPVIEADREEISVIGSLPDPEVAADASEAERAAAAEGRIPPVPRGDEGAPGGDRPGSRAQVPAQGVVGRHLCGPD